MLLVVVVVPDAVTSFFFFLRPSFFKSPIRCLCILFPSVRPIYSNTRPFHRYFASCLSFSLRGVQLQSQNDRHFGRERPGFENKGAKQKRDLVSRLRTDRQTSPVESKIPRRPVSRVQQIRWITAKMRESIYRAGLARLQNSHMFRA